MEHVKAYREGILTYHAIQKINCCVPLQGIEERFRYIEVIFEDGHHHFYYTNEREFAYWEKDFHRNRYTSFHEFWCTEEMRKSDGPVALDYYVRRGPEDYTCVENLDEIREQLKDNTRLTDRMCTYNDYSRTVDYRPAPGEENYFM